MFLDGFVSAFPRIALLILGSFPVNSKSESGKGLRTTYEEGCEDCRINERLLIPLCGRKWKSPIQVLPIGSWTVSQKSVFAGKAIDEDNCNDLKWYRKT